MKGKKVSLFLNILRVIHTMEAKIRELVIIPKGLSKMELINSPWNSNKVALVEPQDGQGIPVMVLKMQNV